MRTGVNSWSGVFRFPKTSMVALYHGSRGGSSSSFELPSYFKSCLVFLMLFTVLSLCGQSAFAGRITAWGSNDYGQCQVPDGDDFIKVVCGGQHSLALKSDGTMSAWGNNTRGQCDKPDGNTFLDIAAGRYHSLAIRKEGTLVAWGWDSDGQCKVPQGDDFVAVAAGTYHSVALRRDGSVVAWGDNRYGQSGNPKGNEFVSVSCGRYYSKARKADGSVIVWGKSSDQDIESDVPQIHADAMAYARGQTHGLAIKTDKPLEVLSGKGLELPGQMAAAGNGVSSIVLTGDNFLIVQGVNLRSQTEGLAAETSTASPVGRWGYYMRMMSDEPAALMLLVLMGTAVASRPVITRFRDNPKR